MTDQSQNSNVEDSLDPDQLFIYVQGICWVPSWSIEDLTDALSYEPRSDDVFIVTYPRSGTTWMQNIVYNLQTEGKPFDIDSDNFFQQNRHLEIDGLSCIKQLQRPYAIKSHLPMDRLPFSSSAKYICVIRNPKDVCVSYFIFYNQWPEVSKLNFDQFVNHFIDGYLPFGNYFESLRAAWQHRHHENVLLVSYEAMRTDLKSIIDQVAAFVEITLNEQLLQRTLEFSSFEYMNNKFDEKRRLFEQKFILSIENEEWAKYRTEIFEAETDLKVVRKGEINNWQTSLTVEQSQRIDQRFRELCQQCPGLEIYWQKWNVFLDNV